MLTLYKQCCRIRTLKKEKLYTQMDLTDTHQKSYNLCTCHLVDKHRTKVVQH
jgi:hypothetical protein